MRLMVDLHTPLVQALKSIHIVHLDIVMEKCSLDNWG